ncbi:hypothetical protein E4M02_11185 [Brevundimonas sp. S30B]|uniref:hypothetical protein n=1 Tax=unclassified Brevundimonas TaxID=2622653 RepID=UPI001072C0EA|nr:MULTISPECIES: hypothetical protein [unclassified Brevundimonas]QBX38678.1 hypothetical protein E4M01_13445 [Brevundimonas sp. MF30-B]TFW01269.1 hypothetical protein E4M02_11185 [Brevundimonas sp. S30B]
MLGASTALSALTQPRVGAGGSPIAFKADPAAPLSGAMGRTGVGGRQVHANVWGKSNLLISFATVLSLGPIQAVDGFTANTFAVTFPGAQGLAAPVEPYRDKMWQSRRLGLPTDAALLPPTNVSNGSPGMTEWTSAHTLPQMAQVFWTMQNNSKRASYESGVPRPLWTLLGMRVWDPRQDSTYPGGSGAQRRDDWRTWTYSESPQLHALAWARGHHKLNADGSIDRTKRLAGVGAPDAAIDIDSFVQGANIAQANGWVISGEWTTADDKWQVLASMLQAGGAVPLNRGAQIGCMTEAPRASILTLTGADIVGPVSLSVMASRRDRYNTVIPRYRSETHRWEQVAAGEVTSSTYRTEDRNEPRTREIAYNYVRLAKQAAELAAYDLATARETLRGSIPSMPYMLGLRAGDAFTVSEPELALNGQKFVLEKRAFDPGSTIVTLEARSETDGKHAWALGQAASPPPSPSLTPPDTKPDAPDAEDWTVTPRPPAADGTQQPGLIIQGEVLDGLGSVLVEVGTSSEGPWQQVYEGPPTSEIIRADGLTPGAAYHVAITYRSVRGTPSDRLILGPYTAPGLTSGGTTVPTDGVNRVPLSNFERNLFGWGLGFNSSGLPVGIDRAEAEGRRYIATSTTFTAAGQVYAFGSTKAFRVAGGERLSCQMGVNTYGVGTLYAAVVFFDPDGDYIGTAYFGFAGPLTPYGEQLAGFIVAPVNAHTAVIFADVHSTGAGFGGGLIIEPMVSGANAGQTEHPPYTTGPIDLTEQIQWIDDTGRIRDGRGLPINAAGGAGIVLSPRQTLYPWTPPHTAIRVVSHTATLVGGYVITNPSAYVTGLSADTTYAVFRDLVAGTYLPISSDTAPYMTSPDRYLFLGTQTTSVDASGTYTPPDGPPPGGGVIPGAPSLTPETP